MRKCEAPPTVRNQTRKRESERNMSAVTFICLRFNMQKCNAYELMIVLCIRLIRETQRQKSHIIEPIDILQMDVVRTCVHVNGTHTKNEQTNEPTNEQFYNRISVSLVFV